MLWTLAVDEEVAAIIGETGIVAKERGEWSGMRYAKIVSVSAVLPASGRKEDVRSVAVKGSDGDRVFDVCNAKLAFAVAGFLQVAAKLAERG